MAKSAYYWFEPESSRTIIKELEKEYDNVVDTAMNLAKDLNNVVCKNNYWCDENSVIFAKWWNQSTNNTGIKGKLTWNKDKGLEVINGDDGVDGEDRMKRIVQEVGKIFWMSVCCTLNGLNAQYSSQIKNGTFKKYYKAATNSNYTTKTDWGGTVWSDMMADDLNVAKKWKSVTLDTSYPKNATSNTKMINDAVLSVKNNLKAQQDNVEKFLTSIHKLLDNTDHGEYWGFSPGEKWTIEQAADDLAKVTRYRLNALQTSLNAALQATIENTEAAIFTLNLTFDVQNDK